MQKLLSQISKCTICADQLEHGVRPVVSLSSKSKILIIGQAPGIKVHLSGVPWDDKSGENLRAWMGIDSKTFYDPDQIGILPMGFCYPGKGKSGDLPPRPECAPKWHTMVYDHLESVSLTILIGQYAQNYYLEKRLKTLTETVRHYKDYLPDYFVLPHPSPRNNIWQAKNKWFKASVLPALKNRVKEALDE